tara:strand:- start:367 stop:801 length:435 start_codon:yes stop_codon:yes gene_type:complete
MAASAFMKYGFAPLLGFAGGLLGGDGGAQASMDASAFNTKLNTLENRAARYGNVAKFIGQNVTDYDTGAELDFGRDLEAGRIARTDMRDLNRGANIKDFEAMLGMKETPLAREQKQRERKFLLDKITKERTAAMEGMFGKIRRS